MALITLRQLLDHVTEHSDGVPAFNINNMERGLAILQASRGARKYAGDIMLRHMVQALVKMKTPASYDYNVTITAKVTEAAHAVGASVEGELGVLGSLETGEAAAEDGSGAEGKLDHSQLLTDPDQAVDFVLRTKCDALAVACGTNHGAYKFTHKPTACRSKRSSAASKWACARSISTPIAAWR